MAGSSEYFLNSPGYVYGYISKSICCTIFIILSIMSLALKAVLVIEYLIGNYHIHW